MTMGSIRWIALGCRWFFLIETQEVRVVVRGRRVMKDMVIPYSKSDLRPLLNCMMLAAAVVAISFLISPNSLVKDWLSYPISLMLRLVPSVAAISSSTSDPWASEITLAIQWLFAPAYIFLWFYILPPWSRRMAQTVSNARRKFSRTRRILSMAIGVLFFSSWLLGDLGIVDFPTFYNGKYVYPLAGAVPQLKLIYTSPTVLAIYAWFGPFAEACIIWMFFAVIMNAKLYSLPPQPENVTAIK